MASKRQPAAPPANTVYALDLEQSNAIHRILYHCLTEVADALLGTCEYGIERAEALAFLSILPMTEYSFWKIWAGAQS